ncbi:hypothetical protein [uncultured Agrobacterium sp.]|uniref:hypothetical protein n=1 Tax=uncultured Agrobacterium sp. TaxID=157277 RepID=UPI0025FBB3F2|nr:hypothetical protein [uncultured Agrobacterium sp.]
MSKIVDQIIGNVVKGAMSEILSKTGVRKTRRARGKAKSGTSLGGGILGGILEAALGEKPARKTRRAPAKKQVSKRRTAAARSKQRAR